MQLTATLTTNPEVTRILVRPDDDVVLKAALLSRGWPPHRRAAPALLEAMALWHQVPVHGRMLSSVRASGTGGRGLGSSRISTAQP